MIPELGQIALMLALCLALAQGILPLAGAANGNTSWIALARPLARSQFLCVALAFVFLGYSFIVNDFSVLNVATNSNSKLPLQYRIAATWGSHEGSLLLWTLMLTGWGVAVSIFSRRLPDDMVARVLGVMGLIGVGFLAFMLFTSNPFDRLLPAAVDGRDLNPLLQDAGMVIHPPMLYMGYVGFSVAFAFAVAALLSGRLDAAWARWSRPWTTVAWLFLTIGIALGSFWAYYELGWGGWWFWDPVENASFMPWLVGTALIHSLAITEKRGAFRSWTVLLAISTFSLSLLGTFLVRSGVLTSVHAFATDPKRGVFILAFLVLVVGASLTLFAWRAPRIGLGGQFDLVSRETALLTNNVLMAATCAAVMLGTLYPLALDALGLGKISVGPPYFETVFVPLIAPAIFLMGIGPLLRWKSAPLPELALRLRWAAAASVLGALIVPFMMGRWSWLTSFGLLLAAWVISTAAFGVWQRLKDDGTGSGLLQRLRRPTLSFYGMQTAHLGIAVFIIGVTLVNGYQSEADVRMAPNEYTKLAGHEFRFTGTQDIRGPNYVAARGTIEVSRDGRAVATLHPEKRIYTAQNMPMTEAAINRGITRDLYVAMGEELAPGTWIVRIWHKPFVNWIWIGCVIMALGGLMAASDRRYRVGKAQ
ncbi:MAG: heme lyase CcmF/NrfE family subunit [Betaproteobacteria bacterium]|nr:MAG: heme lyase CcmF/NrfE family subunit [Betaproteobacteria bacterium]